MWRWIGEGGYLEDEPEDVIRHARGWTRNKNHFHNPLVQQWAVAGLDDFSLGYGLPGNLLFSGLRIKIKRLGVDGPGMTQELTITLR